MSGPDVQLRRVERNAVLACLAMAGLALVGGGTRPAIAVLAGGLLIGLSYLSIGSGVATIAARMTAPDDGSGEPERPPSTGRTFVLVGLRYALLALLAYVMIARLRLHPVGLLAGVSSVVAAAGLEAVRFIK